MIEFTRVTKQYGVATALDAIDLTLADSGIYCLLGRNGAGKTTFLKLLAGHIAATRGRIMVDNWRVSPSHMPANVAFIQNDAVQFNLTVRDLIATAADLQSEFDQDFAQEMVRHFHLDPAKRYKQLSFGMKTMLTTIIILSNNGDVVLLDEPTLGFDAIMRDQFNTLLLESYQAHPRIIIVSTHQIDEIAKVAQQLVVIDRGKIVLHSAVDEIDERAYTISGATTVVEPLLCDLTVLSRMNAGALMSAAVFDHRITVPEGVHIDRLGLQDFFIKLVGGENHD